MKLRAGRGYGRSTNPFLKATRSDLRWFTRLTRAVTGSAAAPANDLHNWCRLSGPMDCLCGQSITSMHHMMRQCLLWIRKCSPPPSPAVDCLRPPGVWTHSLICSSSSIITYQSECSYWSIIKIRQQVQGEVCRGVRENFYIVPFCYAKSTTRRFDCRVLPSTPRHGSMECFRYLIMRKS